jgi:hypothetical protein
MMMNKKEYIGAEAMLDRASSAFEEIERGLQNAIARINGVGERLTERNDRLFGGGPESDPPRGPVPVPHGAVPVILDLLSDLHRAIDRADMQIERQRDLV